MGSGTTHQGTAFSGKDNSHYDSNASGLLFYRIVKQHSILDVVATVPICALCYRIYYKGHCIKGAKHLQE